MNLRFLPFSISIVVLAFAGCSKVNDPTLNIVDFQVLDSTTKKPVEFSLDMQGLPNKTKMLMELSSSGTSRVTWIGQSDLGLGLSADGYKATTIPPNFVRSISQFTGAPRFDNPKIIFLEREKPEQGAAANP